MHAYFLDACNCDWGCPCQFSANPTHGNCEGISGYHIVSGSYGNSDDVKLNGLNMALIASWPGPIHEGHGKASYYIDDRADEKQLRPYQTSSQVKQEGDLLLFMQAQLKNFKDPREQV